MSPVQILENSSAERHTASASKVFPVEVVRSGGGSVIAFDAIRNRTTAGSEILIEKTNDLPVDILEPRWIDAIAQEIIRTHEIPMSRKELLYDAWNFFDEIESHYESQVLAALAPLREVLSEQNLNVEVTEPLNSMRLENYAAIMEEGLGQDGRPTLFLVPYSDGLYEDDYHRSQYRCFYSRDGRLANAFLATENGDIVNVTESKKFRAMLIENGRAEEIKSTMINSIHSWIPSGGSELVRERQTIGADAWFDVSNVEYLLVETLWLHHYHEFYGRAPSPKIYAKFVEGMKYDADENWELLNDCYDPEWVRSVRELTADLLEAITDKWKFMAIRNLSESEDPLRDARYILRILADFKPADLESLDSTYPARLITLNRRYDALSSVSDRNDCGVAIQCRYCGDSVAIQDLIYEPAGSPDLGYHFTCGCGHSHDHANLAKASIHFLPWQRVDASTLLALKQRFEQSRLA